MMAGVSLQVFDNFIINYNVGQVLLVVFVLTTLGALTRGAKILGVNTVMFGLVFVLTPNSVSPFHYRLLGLLLLVVGPLVYVMSGR
ncbi:MAG: protein-S-isoprenylcysteine O-methyltransferase Ste14 [Natronomonas sp.]|jgi:protein-S-isoprenylcysteine O-methyltransferase Ste14